MTSPSRYQTDAEYRERVKAQTRERSRRKYSECPQFRARVKAESSARRHTHRGFVCRATTAARSRSKERGYACDIDPDYMESIIPPDRTCPVFPWVRMEFQPNPGGRGGDATASIDRIDPGGGYTKGNVRWICLRANLLRKDGDATEFLCLARDASRIESYNPQFNHQQEA